MARGLAGCKPSGRLFSTEHDPRNPGKPAYRGRSDSVDPGLIADILEKCTRLVVGRVGRFSWVVYRILYLSSGGRFAWRVDPIET